MTIRGDPQGPSSRPKMMSSNRGGVNRACARKGHGGRVAVAPQAAFVETKGGGSPVAGWTAGKRGG